MISILFFVLLLFGRLRKVVFTVSNYCEDRRAFAVKQVSNILIRPFNRHNSSGAEDTRKKEIFFIKRYESGGEGDYPKFVQHTA